jgi:hypothetical protein
MERVRASAQPILNGDEQTHEGGTTHSPSGKEICGFFALERVGVIFLFAPESDYIVSR